MGEDGKTGGAHFHPFSSRVRNLVGACAGGQRGERCGGTLGGQAGSRRRSPAERHAQDRRGDELSSKLRIGLTEKPRTLFGPMRYSVAAISWRSCWRRRSIGISVLPLRRCQKVQPLHASAPCTWAPILWIEPDASRQAIEPSALTLAAIRCV